MNETPNPPEGSPDRSDTPTETDTLDAQRDGAVGESASSASDAAGSPPEGTNGEAPASSHAEAHAEEPPGQQEVAPPRIASHQAAVTRLTAEYVFAQLEDGRQGAIPLIEFSGQPVPGTGDTLTVIIQSVDEGTGLLALSKQQADELGFWDAVKEGDLLEGVITGMNKGGLDVDIGGARAFLPGSQVDVRPVRDISVLIGEHVKCIVTQVDRTARDLIVSRRKYLRKELKKRRSELFDGLEEGQTRTGTVASLTDYGAFVDVGGANGLLHLTDMTWKRLNHPSDLLKVGQELTVRVLHVDRKEGKISLGLKQLEPDPWDGIETRYPKDKRVTGTVRSLTDFGAFLELEPGIEALLPVSEMSWSRRPVHPSEVVKRGETREVVVLKVSTEKRRISVGLKQLEENPWASVETRFPANATVKGKVTRIIDFGAFVELAPGVEGLIHISELSDRRVRAVGDVVQEGQEVEARVLKVDQAAQRISLSMRPPEPEHRAAEGDRATKKRKRPLRGGLASHFEW